jgi:hypothetical protein
LVATPPLQKKEKLEAFASPSSMLRAFQANIIIFYDDIL